MVQPDASVLEPEPPAAVEGDDSGGAAARYTRSPSDLLRLVLALALMIAGGGARHGHPRHARGAGGRRP